MVVAVQHCAGEDVKMPDNNAVYGRRNDLKLSTSGKYEQLLAGWQQYDPSLCTTNLEFKANVTLNYLLH
jgi:hypothetical protein